MQKFWPPPLLQTTILEDQHQHHPTQPMPTTRGEGIQRRQSPRVRRDKEERQEGLLATVMTTNDLAAAVAGAVVPKAVVPKASRMITPPQPTDKKKKVAIKRTRPKEEYTEEVEIDDDDGQPGEDSVATTAATTTSHVFAGVQYDNYQDMVQAKRERNQRVLQESGLLQAVASTRRQKLLSSQKGLHAVDKRKSAASVLSADTGERRVSKRIRGEIADGQYIEDERGGRVTVKDQGGRTAGDYVIASDQQRQQPLARATTNNYYNGRVNNGEPLSIEQAIQECDAKWIEEDSTSRATMLLQQMEDSSKNLLSSSAPCGSTTNNGHPRTSMTRDHISHDTLSLQAMMQALSVNDEACVAKVCPDRIYSVAVHPSTESTIVCAGDKNGYVGLWKNQDTNHGDDDDDKDIHCLFRPHHGAVSCLEWHLNGRRLWSTSYDGTVRSLDVETRQFDQVFATYDDTDERYKSQLGFGLETDDKFWIQFGCLDPHNEQGLYVSTSLGAALHVDLRSPQQITFHRTLSEKKINTLRCVSFDAAASADGDAQGLKFLTDLSMAVCTRTDMRWCRPASIARWRFGIYAIWAVPPPRMGRRRGCCVQ
jgi:hypothetical protein